MVYPQAKPTLDIKKNRKRKSLENMATSKCRNTCDLIMLSTYNNAACINIIQQISGFALPITY